MSSRRLLAVSLALGTLACSGGDGDPTETDRTTEADRPTDVVGHEVLDEMWVAASWREDGTARILEVIDYDFGTKERHGIFRDIPGLSPDSAVDVESTTAPDDVLLTPADLGTGSGVRVRIGDPDQTIRGEHRYRLGYDLPASEVSNGDEFGWDAVGTGWSVKVREVEIHVIAPFELEDLTCSTGTAGEEGGCELVTVEPGHVVATAHDLGPGEGITVTMRRGTPIDESPAISVPR